MKRLSLLCISSFLMSIAFTSCEKDSDSSSSGGGGGGGGTPIDGNMDTEFLPQNSALFSITENDVVSNPGQVVLDLSTATAPEGEELTFSVDPPLMIDLGDMLVRFEDNAIIDTDDTENPDILEAQDGEFTFQLNAITDSTETEYFRIYTVEVEDLVPDWSAPTGQYDDAPSQGSSNDGNRFPAIVDGQTYHFAQWLALLEDGVNQGGNTTLVTTRTGLSYQEIYDRVDGSTMPSETEIRARAEQMAELWTHLDYWDEPGTEYVLWNDYFLFTDVQFGKALGYMRSELEDAGYTFENWESGIFWGALNIYADGLNSVNGSGPEFETRTKLLAQMSVDYNLLFY